MSEVYLINTLAHMIDAQPRHTTTFTLAKKYESCRLAIRLSPEYILRACCQPH
jgi:hypothetical protein